MGELSGYTPSASHSADRIDPQQSEPGQVEKAVEHAIKTGYRHIDAAVVVSGIRLIWPEQIDSLAE